MGGFHSAPERRGKDRTNVPGLCGAALIALFGLIALMSGQLSGDADPAMVPSPLFAACYAAAGAAFLISVAYSVNDRFRPLRLQWLMAVAVVIRLWMIGAPPILENDFYRYLWDGAVTANHINPYAYSPFQAMQGG